MLMGSPTNKIYKVSEFYFKCGGRGNSAAARTMWNSLSEAAKTAWKVKCLAHNAAQAATA